MEENPETPEVKVQPAFEKHGNIEDILDEEVTKNQVEENTIVDEDDFNDEYEEVETEEEKNTEEKNKPGQENKSAEEVTPEAPEATRKQQAVANLIKPKTIFKFYNMAAGRAGKVITPKKPNHFKLDQDDTEDLGILLEESVREEKWTGIRTKWLLFFVLALILAEKLFTMKKPLELEEKNNNDSGNDFTKGTDKNYQILMKRFDALEEQNKLLREQNKLFEDMIAIKKDKELESEENIQKKATKMRYYKGYDLTKISFTKNGAIIDPSKAGQKGYTGNGTKMGIPGDDIQDIHSKWDMYKNFVLEHSLDIEDAELV